MANTALYYPYINPPADEWTIRAALYWDRIESIIPSGIELSDSTKSLIDEGLLEPVDWINVAAVGHNMENEFVKFIHSRKLKGKFVENWADRHPPQLIHTMKMSCRITDALQETGLGFQKLDDWWAVRPDIASAYMSTLAWHIASRNSSGCDLLTDRSGALDGFRVHCNEAKPKRMLSSGKAREILEVLLKDLFLVPNQWIPPREVRLFKEQFGNELQGFRNHINRVVLDLMQDASSDTLGELVSATRSDLVTQSVALQRRLAPSKMELVRKTVLPSVVGVIAYVLSADYRLATALPVVLVGSEAILASAMQMPERRDAISSHPMAYAALFNDRMAGRQRSRYSMAIRRV